MSTRAPPTTPRSRVVASLMRAPLRQIVVVMTLCGIAWGLAFGIQSFQDIAFDRSSTPSLVTFDIIIGALFAGYALIEILGLVAGLLQRPGVAKMFAYLSVLGALVVCGGHLLIIITHFRFQSQIISECTTAVTGDTLISGNPFWFEYTAENLTQPEAASYCSSAFSHSSYTTIIWLLAAMALSTLFVAVAFAWSYQVQDPSYGRFRRRGADEIRMGAFRPDGQPRYDPPPGMPSRVPYEDRADAFVPPYDSNMPPKYSGAEGDAPPEKDGLYSSTDGLGYGRQTEWSTSETDLNQKPMHEDERRDYA